MTNQIIPEDVLRSYDRAVLAINSLTSEAVELEKKFGTTSNLFKERVKQVTDLRDFYKKNKDFIEHLSKLIYMMSVNNIAHEIIITQKETSLSFGQAADVLGYSFTDKQKAEIDFLDRLARQLANIPK